ncbi:MAG: HEAT repeat protein [Myxococcota bacterium]|jgi:HEAT repeat protein
MTDDLYDKIARGDAPEVAATTIAALRNRAVRAARSDAAEDRLDALRVGARLPLPDALRIVIALVGDDAPVVRHWVLVQALAAGDHGFSALRAIAGAGDATQAASALEHLRRGGDSSAVTTARMGLRSPHPDVRAQAALLLGRIAGPGARPSLQRLLADNSQEVRDAATSAIEALESSAGATEPWWSDPRVLPSPPADVKAPAPAAEPEAPAAPSADGHDATETVSADAEPERDVDPPRTAPALVPEAQEGADSGPPLPLPTAIRPLLRLLGDSPPQHHAMLLSALRDHADADLGGVLAAGPGDDAALARGLAVAAAERGSGAWVTGLRRLVTHTDAAVRAAAITALGALGGASVVPALHACLTDTDPAVRASSVEAAVALCDRLDRSDLLARLLEPVLADTDPAVAASAREALAR